MRCDVKGPIRLLACLLLVQWAGAVLPHARAMARIASAQLVELCSHDGTKRVLLGEDGQPVEPGHATNCCALCFGPVFLPLATPAVMPLPVGYVLAAKPFHREGLPPCPPRAPPQQPRAPPFS